ncbi:RagB/SusD family nutrient uptake outer membrane protein [Sphingobacterium sp. DK4209]|uniref:RagB/SusD family nutrient uptake outer membrane protein n=1 Tax=Sphingobacterium zhuxiongii TaxID=2662364 RepID=A0A5Q0QAM3_9SPHI|nr:MULTISPECIES: RagB/SusD family nutrient uptake outer membrane protein [unclassified Sphingobacterium]MVZ67376.1 RagB/SusD family nutrient uptake outer membrane protein [Sphingobacterium sp. DK4209]QGA26314.1 RagB/SusD family nutrient uptake outer membrane protein [Sphingobacterium sp. dk4302]
MKRLKLNYIALAAALVLGSSCANQLDLYSHSAMSPDAVTAGDLPALRIGMYNNMQNDPGVHNFILFDLLGGDLQTSANTSALNLITSTLSPLNSVISRGWNGYYSSLYQVNNVVDICNKQEASAIRNKTLGEAYYFRALNYYNLIARWGDIPLLYENTLDKPTRTAKAEVWDFIEQNLEEASKLLSTADSYYYVSADAVTALQARVFLTQGKKTEAAQAAEKLINSGKYALDSFEKIFRKQANNEVIFAFENLSEESSINISDLFYSYAHPNKGQGNYRITEKTLSLFAGSDKRRAMTIINIAGTECVNKYPSGQTGRDPVIISRIAEMYLISAEAQGLQNGLARLNQLRAYRGVAAVSPGSETDFLDAVLLERQLELLGENFRYYDLVRTGKAVSTLGILNYQTLLPIPGSELQRNTNLTPNPGY